MANRKKFIFLAINITAAGGGLVYLANKIGFLRAQGWDAGLYSAITGETLITQLHQFKTGVIAELAYPAFFFSDQKRAGIIERIVEENQYYDTRVVVTNSQRQAFWGEMIAKEWQARHIVFLTGESFSSLTPADFRFYNFKHVRRELAGINQYSLPRLFRGYKEIPQDECYTLPVTYADVVQDVENAMIEKIPKKDINIGCISRLEKMYIPKLINEVILFARDNHRKQVQLVFFGGTTVSSSLEAAIKMKNANVPNLNIIITGFLYPIPRKIFGLMDVFIGVAGASKLSAQEGIPTISLDVMDGNPIGVLGYDAGDCFYRQSAYPFSISELLRKILVEKSINADMLNNTHLRKFNDIHVYAKTLQFIEGAEPTQRYYDFGAYRLSFGNRIRKVVFLFFGAHWYRKLLRLKVKLYFWVQSHFTVVHRLT